MKCPERSSTRSPRSDSRSRTESSVFAVLAGGPEFLDELFISGAAVRQFSDMCEQSCIADGAGHKPIIDSAPGCAPNRLGAQWKAWN